MKICKVVFIALMCCDTINKVYCFDPISIGLAVTVGAGLSWLFSSKSEKEKSPARKIFHYVGQKIGFYEGCENYWIPGNVKGLQSDLEANVFGQPIALDMIISSIRHHLDEKNQPRRSLILSFHGPPGVGKNLISEMILKNMFRKGSKTEYVHFFRGLNDFPSNKEIEKYKKTIREVIEEKVYECRRSIFVFDEVEKMPSGILDVLDGFVKRGVDMISGKEYDFRKVIFILLSNIGTDAIIRETLSNWKNGVPRDQMNVKEFVQLIALESYNGEGGFHHTNLVKRSSISHFVPFLPLERRHVVQCLEREVSKSGQNMSNEIIEQVLDHLTFWPKPENIFSFGGCKGVTEQASYLIERETRRQKKKW